nr:unnamed protein product [Callosobruchus analis]
MYWLITLIGRIKHIFDELSCTENCAELEVGLQECDKAIRRINRNLRNAATIGEKQRLSTARTILKAIALKLSICGKKKRNKETAKHRVHWEDSQSAFHNRIHSGDSKAIFERRIQSVIKKNSAVKVNVAFCGEFVISKADKVITEFKYFTTSNSPIYQDTNIREWFDSKVMHPIMKQLQEFQEKDSGWALKRVVNLGVNINLFNPMRGSSYIRLPPQIRNKKACVNVKNDDQACFAWAVVSSLYPAEQSSDRISMYPPYSTILNLKGIQFPMTIHQIKTFENQNDISVNIYTLKLSMGEYTVVPFRLTKEKRDSHVNLLMIHNQDHDHLVPLNNYRGAAHEGCNINFKDNHTIPVVFHNLSGYDAHFIIKDIVLGMNGRVDLLPITKESYIAFTKNISDSLVSFRVPILKSELLQYTEEHIKLLTKKGVYPYDFTDSIDKFSYPHLPSQDPVILCKASGTKFLPLCFIINFLGLAHRKRGKNSPTKQISIPVNKPDDRWDD